MADAQGQTETAASGTYIDVNYTAQSPHMTQAAARATVQGQEMVATVDCFEVQLVADLPSNGGIMLRFIGDQIAAAQDLFGQDAKITARFIATTVASEQK
jgi:hypothetical protein